MIYNHVVMFSGGVCSWAAAKRVVERHGTDGVALLFADTRAEDADLYRFLIQAAENVGAPLIVIADGRTPRQVMTDEKIIGNSRIDPCSKLLKRKLLDKWTRENCTPETVTLYIGYDWTEAKRIDTFAERMKPWRFKAPMADPPYMTKEQMLQWQEGEGIKRQSLYVEGFHHNNCGGACIKAGQAQWELLLRKRPETYREWEDWEDGMREFVGDHSILRDRSGGTSKPLTLRKFREGIQLTGQYDMHDWGGCGCAIDGDD